MQRRSPFLLLLLAGLLLVTACTPGQVGTSSGPGGAAAPAPEKTLTVAIQLQPSSFDSQMTLDSTGGRTGGRNNVGPLVNASPTWRDFSGNRQLGYVTELPSTARGTWVANPDGTMTVTWKLRPDFYWHDGTPITAEDFVFRFTVTKTLNLQSTGGGRADLVASVSAPDAHTFVQQWSGIYVGGLDGLPLGGIGNLPKHILGPVFEQNPEALSDHRHFTTEYVGDGPFRLVRWEQGSHMEFERFEQYFLGPAKIHRLFLRFVPDINTMVANILAESVDVLLPQGVDLDTAAAVRDRWQREGKRHQVESFVLRAHIQMELMLDPEYARPVEAWMQVPVRQALYTALDRQEIANVMSHGLSPPADSHYNPVEDPNYEYVKNSIPRYPYDPARARQLLAQGGWTPGPDGVLVHQSSGERFRTLLYVTPTAEYQKMGAMVQSYWNAVGADTTVEVIIPAFVDDNRYLSTRSGPLIHNPSGNVMYESRLSSRRIPTEANRWTGNNRGRLNSPVIDDPIERIARAIEPAEQAALHRQFIDETTGKVTAMPLFWETWPILMLENVTGPKIFGNLATYEVHTWDKR